jgi:UDP-N-acetylglucosamine acyltransferase
MGVHPTAVISEGVEVGDDVEIGPYAIVEAGVVIGRGCQLASHSILRPRTILGEGVVLDSFAVIGGDPQMAGFDVETCSRVEIGDRTRIREGVTVHRSIHDHGVTRVGADCFLMSQSHIGHDCTVEDKVTLGNNVLLAGHVSIGTQTFLGGGVGIHQFCRVGESVMVGGNATLISDAPSFTMTARHNRLYGLNLVGLRRRGFTRDEIRDLKNCLQAVYMSQEGSPHKLAKALLEDGTMGKTAPGRRFLEFMIESSRGYVRPANRA